MILLDGIGGPILIAFPVLGILFLVAVVFLEAYIMKKFKWGSIKKCRIDSFGANLGSLILGIFSFYLIPNNSGLYLYVLYLFIITVISEGIILKIIRPEYEIRKVAVITITMNVASYLMFILLYLLTGLL